MKLGEGRKARVRGWAKEAKQGKEVGQRRQSKGKRLDEGCKARVRGWTKDVKQG